MVIIVGAAKKRRQDRGDEAEVKEVLVVLEVVVLVVVVGARVLAKDDPEWERESLTNLWDGALRPEEFDLSQSLLIKRGRIYELVV